jgi:hypothetical protein
MKKIVRVVVRLRGRSALAKLDQARFVVQQMNGNANFPTLAAQVTALGVAVDTLAAAITNARSGDHEMVGLKQIAEAEVMDLLSKLCDAINGVAAGDMAKLLTCGLPMRRENQPIGPLPPPVKLVNRLTTTTGGAKLEWDGPEGTRMFNIYMSVSNDPFSWEMIGVTTKQRYVVEALEPGKFYWFAVTAIGAAGESSKSEPARVMAAA